jgi:recombination protein RecA
MHLKINNDKEFMSAVVGMVLGDGYICPITKRNPNARISLGHGMKQEDYLRYKLSILEYLTRTSSYYKTCFNKKTDKFYNSISGSSMCHPFYSKVRRMMYDDSGRKLVSRGILNLLDPVGLSLWYMDDGCKHVDGRGGGRKDSIELSTCSFNMDEHIVILDYFRDVWGIDTRIHTKKSDKYLKLYINNSNALKFMSLVEPYIHESMSYKIVSFTCSGDHQETGDDIVRTTQ